MSLAQARRAATAEGPRDQAVWHGLLAHDLKNALALLEGQLEHLARVPSVDDAARAHRQCRELRQRLVMMLTVSRAQATDPGQQLQAWVTDEDPMALLDSVAATAQAYRPELQTRIVAGDQGPAFWTYDAHLVRMALDAALNNALRFAATRIELRVAARDGGLSLQITDDGPGPAGEPVWTPPGVEFRSTGVGMALCRAVAQAHHCAGRTGEVRLRTGGGLPGDANDASGLGATFELWLP
jgi:signal transduction histidine kinase